MAMRAELEKLIEQGAESPFYKLLDMKIEEVRSDYARLSIELCEKHLQFLKTVHGGVIAALADSAAAWAAISVSNPNSIAVTVEMKINFLRPVGSGKLTAEARNIHKGSRIFVSDVEVKNSVGELVAKALITYYLVQKQGDRG